MLLGRIQLNDHTQTGDDTELECVYVCVQRCCVFVLPLCRSGDLEQCRVKLPEWSHMYDSREGPMILSPQGYKPSLTETKAVTIPSTEV